MPLICLFVIVDGVLVLWLVLPSDLGRSEQVKGSQTVQDNKPRRNQTKGNKHEGHRVTKTGISLCTISEGHQELLHRADVLQYKVEHDFRRLNLCHFATKQGSLFSLSRARDFPTKPGNEKSNPKRTNSSRRKDLCSDDSQRSGPEPATSPPLAQSAGAVGKHLGLTAISASRPSARMGTTTTGCGASSPWNVCIGLGEKALARKTSRRATENVSQHSVGRMGEKNGRHTKSQ